MQGGSDVQLNRKEALRAYARMMNTLDVKPLEGILAPEFTYESQWVFEALQSRQAFLDYIRPKLATIAKADSAVYAEMGTVAAYGEMQPCVILAQDHPENLVALVFANVRDGLLVRLDLCAVPPAAAAERSGEYPR